jgi:hypothetical protein
MPALDGWKEAAFVGYFGPIGRLVRREEPLADNQAWAHSTGHLKHSNTYPKTVYICEK